MMTTSANHAGTEKRFSEVVWTSIHGVDIIRTETSFWENDTFLSHERPFFSSFTSHFLLVSSLRIPWEESRYVSIRHLKKRAVQSKNGLVSRLSFLVLSVHSSSWCFS